MPIYRLAKEYGQSPDDVWNWNASTFDEAWDLLIAENTEKWPDDCRPQVVTTAPSNTILDHDQSYWRTFIVKGRLDTERLTASGYTAPQIPWLAGEMRKLGWLE